MNLNNEFLAIIPARAGSKGIHQKNLQLIGKKPMIQYTIEAASKVLSPKNIIITSNDQKVLDIANELGLSSPFIRPEELSTDKAETSEVIRHALNWVYSKQNKFPRYFILLQPTSPFRNSNDIISAIKLFKNSNKSTLISASEPIQHPGDCITKNQDGHFVRINIGAGITERQSYPETLFIDGGIYISETNYFLETLDLIGEDPAIYRTEQFNAIDIDSPFDLELARAMYNLKQSHDI